jgi:hypothetical protein
MNRSLLISEMACSPVSPGSLEAELWTNRELLQILSGKADQFANGDVRALLHKMHMHSRSLLVLVCVSCGTPSAILISFALCITFVFLATRLY